MSDPTNFPRLSDELEAGLTAYMTDPDVGSPSASRAAAIETILRDWLVAHRYMPEVPKPVPVRLDSQGINREEVQYPGFIK
ncbi:hypothetical protein IB267_17570 [Ensifer sp. ENS09]|uniref:hypothetical protein n=1 Tax=Ensifer sp. ENS09 TaxID=2769263 RepID=UPI0017874617|nr:hypothetical protein [Ensifer sp. ENS09]MBD9650162.1 hypothetical protein [Ensifer sp. ENS09]